MFVFGCLWLFFGWPGSRLVVTQVGARLGGCRASFCPVCCDVEGSSLARPQSAECACRKAGPLGGCRAGYCPRQATEQGELAAVVQCRDSGPESHTQIRKARSFTHTQSPRFFLLSFFFRSVLSGLPLVVCRLSVAVFCQSVVNLPVCQPVSLSVRCWLTVASFFCCLFWVPLGASTPDLYSRGC